MNRLLPVRSFPSWFTIWLFFLMRFTGSFFLTSSLAPPLNCAFVVLEMRICNLLSAANSVPPSLLAPLSALFLSLGFHYDKSSIKFLILLPKDFHWFCHLLQEFCQPWVVGSSRNVKKGLHWVVQWMCCACAHHIGYWRDEKWLKNQCFPQMAPNCWYTIFD